MSASDTMWDYARTHHWDTLYQLELCLEYIERQGNDEAFEDFLKQNDWRASEEEVTK